MPAAARRRARSTFLSWAALLALTSFCACAPTDDPTDDYSGDTLREKVVPSEQYEAEERAAESGCSLRTNHAGFTGPGFMDYGGNGTWIEWRDIEASAAGQYELDFRYANGSRADRHTTLQINGQSAGEVAFGPTGNWKTWGNDTVRVALRAGSNTLRVLADTGRGGPNLDHVVVTALDLCPDDPSKEEPGECGCGKAEGQCSQTGLCADAVEGGTVTLACPGSETITSIGFASYGTPEGSCDGGFETGSCHANSSRQRVEQACLGESTCRVGANNGTFSDPCQGVRKRLAVHYTCGIEGSQPGLIREHYSGLWNRLPDFSALQPDARDVAETVGLGPYAGTERFGLVLSGHIAIDQGGSYDFELGSDDGSRLMVDGQLVVDNDGLHGFLARTGTANLSSGLHTLRVEFFERTGGDRLRLRYRRSGGSFAEVPASVLSHGDPDGCPDDPLKTHPGACGCGMPDADDDGDGSANCQDNCPGDGSKTQPGVCGCGSADTDSDGDGTPDCNDACPEDAQKRQEGECGCGVEDGTCGPVSTLPVKVFILAGQSNMVGTGTISPNDTQLATNGGMGTLEYLVTDSPLAGQYQHLLDDNGDWAQRDDVWIVDQAQSGPLTVGYGSDTRHIGPELQFGHVMGDLYENPVLIIKVAWGGKSLFTEFRPPSAGGEVGPNYTLLIDRVRDVLNNLEREMPGYDGQGYELAGFGWHQGWNDRVNQTANNEYQTNCVHFINDVRDALGAPNLPFVLATTGMTGWDETHPRALSLMEAQLAVPDDERLNAGLVSAVETRDFWRDVAESPANQGYHWNRNAETYVLIGEGMGDAMVELMPADDQASIENVYFAQTHVQEPEDALFELVGGKEALLKVQVTAPEQVRAPAVTAVLRLNGHSTVLQLAGPDTLPTRFESEPGQVQHTYEDSFTTRLPASWVQPGLSVTVNAGNARKQFDALKIGAPTRVVMNMFDVSYFVDSPGDYPAGWDRELEAKWPVAGLEVRRTTDVLFSELIIPPRAGVGAARVISRDDYKVQTGLNFDGEQAAALQWKSALKAAAGTAGRWSLYYVNIYGVHAGGQAGGYGGVGNGRSQGILHHELGHALSLPHWCTNTKYPYHGAMHGIPAPNQGDGPHVGPTWAFDLPSGRFIPPTVQAGTVRGAEGEYKADPMCGGGWGDQEAGFLMRHFSDYSVNQMRNYLQNHVVEWNPSLGEFASWDANTGDYTRVRSNNGVQYPTVRDTQVISVMAGVGVDDVLANPDTPNLVYPPIGPYNAGLIDLFDPNVAADRARADQVYCPNTGCDFSLRIVQGGVTRTYMLPISQNPGVDPLSGGALQTRAVNLPASGGEVTSVELLCTPDAEKDSPSPQQPACPVGLATWSR